MVWQKLKSHVNGGTVRVESAKGDTYPAETKNDRLNNDIYEQMVNDAHEHVSFWAWVEFDDGTPILKDWARGDKPTKPPWEHP